MKYLILTLAYLVASLVWAEPKGLAKGPQKLIIQVGHLIDGESSKTRGPHTIEVLGNEITNIHQGHIKIPGAKIIDLKDSTVLPGFMDLHTHLSVTFNQKTYLQRFQWNSADYAIHGVQSAEKTLMAGFTTVRDLGDFGYITVSLKKAIMEGKIPGPRIYTAGKSIATTGGHADPTNGYRKDLMGFPGPEQGVINGPLQARAAVRQRYKNGADVIKITATGGVLSTAKSGQNPQFTDDELKAVVDTANDYGFTVAAHAHGKLGMIRAIKAGVTSIEHGTYMDDEVIALMKKHGTWFVPTIMAGKWVGEKAKIEGFFPEIVRPKAAKIGPIIFKTFARAYKKGVKIAFGTDSGVSAHGQNAEEFELMVQAGMPPMAAIKAATLSAAKLLRIDNKLGSLKKGKLADIVAVKGDPIKNISLLKDVTFVMKDGKVYKGVKPQDLNSLVKN